MVRVVVVALLLTTGAALGCHSASGPGSGQSTGGAGTSGSAADAAGALVCSDAGATGGIGGDGLPFCQVTSRPSDPLNAGADAADDASGVPATSNDNDNCNRLQTAANDAEVIDCLTGPVVKPEKFVVAYGDAGTDGGRAVVEAIAEDGGAIPAPTGGTLVDGDYQLVRYRSLLSGAPNTRRTIALYDGATYVEWAADEKPASTTTGAREQVLRLNTSMSASGSTWAVANVNCGSLTTAAYGYTADGTTLELFDFDASGDLQSIYTYQRICSR